MLLVLVHFACSHTSCTLFLFDAVNGETLDESVKQKHLQEMVQRLPLMLSFYRTNVKKVTAFKVAHYSLRVCSVSVCVFCVRVL